MNQRLLHPLHHLRWGLAILSLLAYGCPGHERMDQAEKLALARSHLRAERYYSALSLLHNIPPTDENTAELHLLQALAYFKLEDYPNATTALEQANPRSPGLQILLAYFHLLGNDLERANALADSLVPLHGSSSELALLRGNISLQAHRYLEAERHFQATLAMDQRAVKAYIGLGHTALLQRRFGKAEEYYLRAVFLSADEIGPQLVLVNYYVATQRYDDAEETLRLTLARYHDNVMLQMSLVSLYIKMHRSREAIDLLEAVLTSMPFSNYIKILSVRLYFSLNHLDKAHNLILKILNDNSDSYHGLILYGEYLFRNADYDLSINYFNKALNKNPNSFLSYYYIAIIYLRKDNIHLATYFLEKSIQANPTFPNAHLLISTIYLKMRKYHMASDYANAVLNVSPNNIEAHLINGIVFYLQGHYNSAIYEFNVVEMLDPQNLSVKLWHALIELEQHHPKDAEKYVSALTASVTEKVFLQEQILQEYGIETLHLQQQLDGHVNANHDPVTWLILGHVYYTRADYARAEVAYRHAIAVPYPNVLPYYAMAQVEVWRGNGRQAIAYLEQAVMIDPTFVKSYRALGSLYEQGKNYQQARVTYQRGLQYAPDDPTLLNNLAWAHLMLGVDMGTAYMHIRKAITLAPDDPDLQDTLAWWCYLTQDYPQAISLLKKLVKTQPDHAIYYYHLGMVYLKSGDNKQARQHLQQALDLGIDPESRRLINEHIP